jgi:predicted O-methyltransferase YrrM
VHAALQYLWHWLTAVNEHSLHSPFLYTLYTKTIQNKVDSSAFKLIEEIRKNLISSNEKISVLQLGAVSKVNNNQERPVSAIAKRGLSSAHISKLLFALIRDYGCSNIVELGTSFGINSLYMAANQNTNVFTFEGCQNTAKVAKNSFRIMNSKNIELIEGNIDSTLPKFCKEFYDKIDLAFIDANHQYEPTLQYFELLLQKTDEHSIILIDDIYWSKGMTKAWRQIIRHPQVTATIDLYKAGIVFFKPELKKQHYRLRF